MTEERLIDITPQEAWDILQEKPGAVLIDIRSTMEYLFVGHAKGALLVPWIDEPDWTVNPDFITEIRKLTLGGSATQEEASAPLILICRSGKRTQEAGKMLIEAGFKHVHHVAEGFEGELDNNHQRGNIGGWRFRNLPWEQS